MEQSLNTYIQQQIRYRAPDASASISGSDEYPAVRGKVTFLQTQKGVVVTSELSGLPDAGGQLCAHPVFAMHIHAGGSCTGNAEDPFADAGGHYNPGGCAHPFHAGDLPPLFSNGGAAWCSVLTDRFTVRSVIGRTVIVHSGRDDFTTQPAGDSGAKIACGVIEARRRGAGPQPSARSF